MNIDKKIDEGKCPEPSLCTVGTTVYTEYEREHICYKCWLNYCKREGIEITYEDYSWSKSKDNR